LLDTSAWTTQSAAERLITHSIQPQAFQEQAPLQGEYAKYKNCTEQNLPLLRFQKFISGSQHM